MNKKKDIFSTLLFIIFLIPVIQAQNESLSCGTADINPAFADTLPWFGNNEFLGNFADSIDQAHPNPNETLNNRLYGVDGVEFAVFRIPVNLIVYSNPNISYPQFNVNAQGIIDVLNFQYRKNNIPIRFYLFCSPNYNVFPTGDINDMKLGDAISLDGAYSVPSVLNVHVVEDINSATGIQYPFLPYAVFIQRTVAEKFTIHHSFPLELNLFGQATTLTHEVGHLLGLFHTFQFGPQSSSTFGFPCFREAVARGCVPVLACPNFNCFSGIIPGANCSSRGDFLCDTPADFRHEPYEDNNCNLATIRLDFRDDVYAPDVKNIMSFTSPRCATTFSPSQNAVMLNVASAKFSPHFSTGIREFDVYEPDNNKTMAREILFGSNNEQIHSFHADFPLPVVCDEDWLKFSVGPTQSGIIEIETNQEGAFLTDTELRLFDSNLSQLAFDDDGNGNGFSKITIRDLATGTYYIKVNYKFSAISTSTRYKISLTECIPFDDCVSGAVNSGEIKLYAATNILTSPCPSTTFIINSGAKVEFRAENEIFLGPGFSALPGADFIALIESPLNCSDDNTIRIIDSSGSFNNHTVAQAVSSPLFNSQYNGQAEGVNEKKAETFTPIVIYPNPSKGSFGIIINNRLFIKKDSQMQTFRITIQNMLGTIIYSTTQSLTNHSIIDLSAQPKGVYFVKVYDNEKVYTEKVILR